jgi:hypothetical protein
MIIKNEELLALLNKAGDIVLEVREIGKKIADLEEERQVKAIAHQKIKEEIMPLMEQYKKDLGEFEDIVQVEVVLDVDKKPTEDIDIKVVDRVEEFKRLFKEEQEKQKKAKETATPESKEEVKS